MADLVLEDLVIETTQTTGVGTYSLDGPVSPFRGIVAAIGTGKAAPFIVTDGAGNIERILGTVTDATPDTLARTKILWSTNAGAAVNWGAGVKYIRLDLPAYMFGSLVKDVRTITVDTTVTIKDNGVLFLGNMSADRDLDLPAAASLFPGFTIGAMKVIDNTKKLSLDPGASDIHADLYGAKLEVAQLYEVVWLVWDGAEWKIAAHHKPMPTRERVYAPAFFA